MATQVEDKNALFKSKLENMLKEIRNINDKATEIVELLEKGSYKPNEHDLQFCQAYIIKLIQTYCKDSKDESGRIRKAKDKVELMLVSCGLLSGYEFKVKEQGNRIMSYCEFVKENNYYNSLIRDTWNDAGTIATKTREILNDMAKELAEQIVALMSTSNGDLGLIESIPKGILILPKPYILARAGLKPESRNLKSILMWLLKFLKDILNRNEFVPICMLIIAVSVAKLSFSLETRSNYPEQYSNHKNNLPVERITIASPEMVVLPGKPIQIPIIITPDEAKDTFITCNSSQPSMVYQLEGVSGTIFARNDVRPETETISAVITVIPEQRTSPDVYDELNVIVDYAANTDPVDSTPVTASGRYPS